LVDEVLEEELKSDRDIIKPRTFGYESVAPTDFESDSEHEEVVRKLLEELEQVRFAEFSKLPPQEERKAESSLKGTKRKRSKIHKIKSRKKQRGEVVEFLERNARPVRIHEEDNELIKSKIQQLRKDKLMIFAIDVEKMSVKGHLAENVDIACWIAITDIEGKVLLNTLIRIPITAIEKTYKEFHGINKRMVKNGTSFNLVTRITFKYCKKADRIIMASLEGNFDSLRIQTEDYNLLLPKIRDVGKLMSGTKNSPFAIKFITYLLFRAEDQKNKHSPVLDCHLTMLSYLYDYEYLEKQTKEAKERCPILVRKNYLRYRIPSNPKMSVLIQKFSDIYNSWPRKLVDKYQYKIIGKRIWNNKNFVESSFLGYFLAERFF
jgi:hypothetical protein